MELKYLYYTPLFFNGIIFDLTGGYSIIDKKKSKKLILIRSNVDFDNRLIPLLEQERLDFEIVDVNQLVCDGHDSRSNILVIPEFFYHILDNCMDKKISSNKLDTILMSNNPNTMGEKKNNSKSLNVLDYMDINSSYDKIKNIIMKHIEMSIKI